MLLSCFIVHVLSSLSSMDVSLDIDFNIYDIDVYERKQTSFAFSVFVVLLVIDIDVSMDIDFEIFDIEFFASGNTITTANTSINFMIFDIESVTSVSGIVNIKFREKMGLSSFKGLAIRQNLGNWARVSVVVARDAKVVEKASIVDVYGREQVFFICFIKQFITTLDIIDAKVIVKASNILVAEVSMEFIEKLFAKVVVKFITFHLRLFFSTWICYITSWISVLLSVWITMILLYGMHQSLVLLLVNRMRLMEINYKGRPKVKIKQLKVLHYGQIFNEYTRIFTYVHYIIDVKFLSQRIIIRSKL